MNQYNEDLLLAKRNIAALGEGMKLVEKHRQEHDRRLSVLQVEVASIRQQVLELSLTVAILRAKMHGGGPTV